MKATVILHRRERRAKWREENGGVAWRESGLLALPPTPHPEGNRHERRKRVVLLEWRVRELKRRDAAKAFRQAAKDAKRAESNT